MAEKKGFKKIDDLGATGQLVAANVQRLRLGLNLTYAALEKRLDAIGNKIPELGLRRIEAQARRVDADDLTALAVALEVSPLTLLLPEDGDYEAARISGVPDDVASNVLWRWALCEEPLRLPLDPVAGAEEDPRNIRAMQAYSLRAKPEVFPRAITAVGFVNAPEGSPSFEERIAEDLARETALQNPEIRFE